jgi:hypothetical protein
MDDHFFFIFSQGCSPSYFALVLVTWNWSDKVFWCNNILFFLGCERGLGYDLSLFIYTIVGVGGMGDLLFLGGQA